ncbi:MAG: hypothetical protein E6767_08050 [Dysgonomonas sp.]|nr:hypothetical protein [Dysgonomonas sp.]
MKKFTLLFFISVLALSAYGQDSYITDYDNGIETSKDLKLSTGQVAKIKKLRQEIGPKFAAIGKDRTLSGYEKGKRKRELALQHKEDIKKILSKEQITIWESKHGNMSKNDGLKNIIADNYDDKLEYLEKKYEAVKKMIENNAVLDKNERKSQLKSLKSSYKAEKEKLKNEKDIAKDKGY